VWIELAGDVAIPGVYQVCQKVDFVQVITRSVGSKIATGALLHRVRWPIQNGWKWNLRQTRDGWRITGSEMSAFQKHALAIPLSLNRETREGLTVLPGIGAHLAEAIIREREKRGGFRSIDELRCVNGVGEKILSKIRSHLTL
jgi:competence protein ComEA